MNLKGIPFEKLAMQNFIFTASINYRFTYTTFLTAEDKQIWHNFINIYFVQYNYNSVTI